MSVTLVTTGAGSPVRARELCRTTVLLSSAGEIDAATAPAIFDAIAHRLPGYHQLVLDLSDVAFFGAAGYAMLRRVDTLCARTATDWVLVTGTEVRRLLQICDPQGELPTAPNIVSAAAALARGPHRTPQLGTVAHG